MPKIEIEIEDIGAVAEAVAQVEGRVIGATDEQFIKHVLVERLIALTAAGKNLIEAKKLARSDFGIKGQFKSKEEKNEDAEP